MKGNSFEKKYGIPHTKNFGGVPYTISAATKYGVSKGAAEDNKDYLTSLGFSVRTVRKGNEYYVYACKK